VPTTAEHYPSSDQMDSAHALPFYFFRIHFSTNLHLFLGLPLVCFFQVSPPQPFVHFSSIRATYTANIILLDFITRMIICGEEQANKIYSAHYATVSGVQLLPLFWAQIASSAPSSQILSVLSFTLCVKDQV